MFKSRTAFFHMILMPAEEVINKKGQEDGLVGHGGGANPKKDNKRLCQFWDFIGGDRLFLT